MSLQPIPERALCSPAFRPVINASLIRRACAPRAAASFANWIANRWSPAGVKRPSHARVLFRKERKPGALSVALRIFVRQAPALLHESSLHLAFFHNLLLLSNRPKLHSTQPNIPEALLKFHFFNLRLWEKTFDHPRGRSVAHSACFQTLNASFVGDRAPLASGMCSQRVGWPTRWNRSFISAGAAGLTLRASTVFFVLSNRLRLTVVLPSGTESRFNCRHFLTGGGFFLRGHGSASSPLEFLAISGGASRLVHENSTSDDGGTTHPTPVSLAPPTQMKFRGAEMARWVHLKPAAMVYARVEGPGVKAFSSFLHEVKKSISEIRVPAAASAPEVDVRQLTRQVYGELERELRIERERRGR